jgi:hypothetical protein
MAVSGRHLDIGEPDQPVGGRERGGFERLGNSVVIGYDDRVEIDRPGLF